MGPTTFPAVLADQVRRSGSRPLVTFYDDATGERVELSVVTFANWVAKTAGLAQDELGLERGDLVLVDLPTHWLTPVWLGAAWSVGASVTPDPEAPAALVVCGPDSLPRYSEGGVPVVALSLRPMAGRFAEPVPDGVVDYGAVVWGQPDLFVADDPPGPADEAWRRAGTARSQEQLLTEATASVLSSPESRVLTDVDPCEPQGLSCFLAPLLGGGGTVWVRHPDPASWESRSAAERVTARVLHDPDEVSR